MPLHDWTKAEAGAFHEVHAGWLIYLRDALNDGRLPPGYRAHAERRADLFVPDVLALEPDPPPLPEPTEVGGVAVAEPQTSRRLTLRPDPRPIRVLAVRHTTGERIVAVVELVSAGNKDRPESVREFASKVASLLRRRVNVSVVDVHLPGKHDPGGMPVAVSRQLRGERPGRPPKRRPYTFAAFRSNPPPLKAFLDDLAVGDPLPATPLFLESGVHVRLPLEETYQRAVAPLGPKTLAALATD